LLARIRAIFMQLRTQPAATGAFARELAEAAANQLQALSLTHFAIEFT